MQIINHHSIGVDFLFVYLMIGLLSILIFMKLKRFERKRLLLLEKVKKKKREIHRV